MGRMKEIEERIKSCECWNETVPASLREEYRKLIQKYGLPGKYKSEIEDLRSCWSQCINSTSKDRFVLFLSKVYEVAEEWKARGLLQRRLKAASKKYRITLDRDLLGFLIKLAIEDLAIDRRTRHRWVCVLRYFAAFEVQPVDVEKAIVAVGGINECARRWQRMRRFKPPQN